MAMAPYNNAPETGTRNGRPAGRGPGAGALVGGALFVGVIAVCALVISYHGIFQFAEYGGHEGSPLAHVFPVSYTLLLLMAFWVSYMLRSARPGDRLWVDVVLIPILILVAAVAMLLSNLELIESVSRRVANVIVAVAPLAALLVAFLLWITVRAHIRRRRRAAPRPQPSEDRATVLPARAVALPEDEEEDDEDELSTRLLRLGTVVEEPPSRHPAAPAEIAETAEAAEAVGSSASEEPAEPEESRTRDAAPALSGLRSEPEPPEEDLPGEPESSVPTVPLPRRSNARENPIKRAVAEAPVVPGAARPSDPEPWPTGTTVVPDHLADEGFQHEPPPGDPVTDEAEAPPLVAQSPSEDDHSPVEEKEAAAAESAPVPEDVTAPEPSVPEPYEGTEEPYTPDPRPEPDPEHLSGPEAEPATDALVTRSESTPGPGSEPEPETEPEAETEAGSALHHEPAPEAVTTPGAELWEPPEDDAGTNALDGYVPPVWTPPEEDGEDGEPRAAEAAPAPALHHDTGPEVRAAFRITPERTGTVPPGAARPTPEPEDDPRPEAKPEPEPELEPERPVPGERPLHEPRAEPEAKREPERPVLQKRPLRKPVVKRPMVLKPPRPPMPDFSAEPPSRRVRSEPLRPED